MAVCDTSGSSKYLVGRASVSSWTADRGQLLGEAHLAAMVDDVDAAHAERLVVVQPLHACENPGQGRTPSHICQPRSRCLYWPHAQAGARMRGRAARHKEAGLAVRSALTAPVTDLSVEPDSTR